MTPENKLPPVPAPPPINPKCPFCDVQPCLLGMKLISFGGGLVAAAFCCAACSKIISVAPVGMPEMPALNERSSLILPS